MRNPIKEAYKKVQRELMLRRDRSEAATWLDARLMQELHQKNRQLLRTVPEWIDDRIWKESIFQYGLPANVRHLIDLDIGEGASYTDAMLALSKNLTGPISYLEIGVSVGRNFFQVANYFENASLTGFDIEEINPKLADYFEIESRREFATAVASIKKCPSSLTRLHYRRQRNTVDYLSGDVFDPIAWQQLSGRKFNIIFSDAFHSAEALQTEAREILRQNLMDPGEVIVVWDDLHNEMAQVFRDICEAFGHARPKCRSNSFIVPLKGWLGDNWEDHPVGLFISLPQR